MIYIITIIILILNVFNIESDSNNHITSLSQLSPYPSFCQKVAENNSLFTTFRRDAIYNSVVETLTFQQGLLFEQKIKKEYPELLQYIKAISIDDLIGNPIRYIYSIGTLSPTTMRYIKIAGDLKKEFGDLRNFNIVEIGGGYGGQCNVLNTITGFKNYTIIDLPECKDLISKCLNAFKIKNCKIIECTKTKNPLEFDLFISNYAFAEIKKEDQINYIKNIINFCPRGYIIYNVIRSPIKSLDLNEFTTYLSTNNRIVKVKAENPATGPNNWIIIWHPK